MKNKKSLMAISALLILIYHLWINITNLRIEIYLRQICVIGVGKRNWKKQKNPNERKQCKNLRTLNYQRPFNNYFFNIHNIIIQNNFKSKQAKY